MMTSDDLPHQVRTALDFVEVPALLLERFANEPAVLCVWARHARTGEPLPPELAARSQAAARMFGALETQQACLHALVDLRLHGAHDGAHDGAHGGAHDGARNGAHDGAHDGAGGGLRSSFWGAPPWAPPPLWQPTTALWQPEQSARLVQQLTAAHTQLPVEPDAPAPRWHAGFRHLAHYGAGYYTYLWARSVSSRVWRRCFADDPLGGAGERWCSTVLQHGGSREPRELLGEMLGGRAGEAAPGTAPGELAEEADAVEEAVLRLAPVGVAHTRS